MLKFRADNIVVLEDGLHHDRCAFNEDQVKFLKKVEVEHDQLVSRAYGVGARERMTAVRKRLQKVIQSL